MTKISSDVELRDYFAGIALEKLLSDMDPLNIEGLAKDRATLCYKVADAMVQAARG